MLDVDRIDAKIYEITNVLPVPPDATRKNMPPFPTLFPFINVSFTLFCYGFTSGTLHAVSVKASPSKSRTRCNSWLMHRISSDLVLAFPIYSTLCRTKADACLRSHRSYKVWDSMTFFDLDVKYRQTFRPYICSTNWLCSIVMYQSININYKCYFSNLYFYLSTLPLFV